MIYFCVNIESPFLSSPKPLSSLFPLCVVFVFEREIFSFLRRELTKTGGHEVWGGQIFVKKEVYKKELLMTDF